jgi:hypothetical protein
MSLCEMEHAGPIVELYGLQKTKLCQATFEDGLKCGLMARAWG